MNIIGIVLSENDTVRKIFHWWMNFCMIHGRNDLHIL